MLKSRVITDIVSFCDCLVTRSVPTNALQAMDGLDKLIVDSNQSSVIIDDFVTASNFQTILQTARDVRDKVGGHIEIDEAYTLADILADLDNYDLRKGLDFFESVDAVFSKTCRSILYLCEYAIDGARLHSLGMSHVSTSVPYAGDTIVPQIPRKPPSINDEQAYWSNLRHWLDGDDAQKEDARHFFGQAFSDSQVIEIVEETERIGSGHRMSKHELRKAHQFLSSVLSDGLSDFDFIGVIELIVSCRSGWPYPLAEILVRNGRNASAFRQWHICYALGDISSSPHAIVCEFLEACADSNIWPLRLQAALARFKIFVQNEGLFRLNHKGQTTASFDTFVESLLSPMSELERLICQLAFASIISGPHFGAFLPPFQSNYENLQNQIELLCLSFLDDGGDKSKAGTLKQLLQSNDYVGICLLVALDCDNQHPMYIALIDNCCNGSIVTTGHDQAARHLAMCLLLKKEHHTAFEIVQRIANRNPEWVDIQILAAEILADTPDAEDQAKQEIDRIRKVYSLTPDFEMRLNAIETKNAAR